MSVLLIASIIYGKEMWNIFFSQIFSKKQKVIPPQPNQESVVALPHLASVPEVVIPYEVLIEGAIRIIYQTIIEDDSDVRLYSYVYANGWVRRVVVKPTSRFTLMSCRIQNFESEAENFKSAYLSRNKLQGSQKTLPILSNLVEPESSDHKPLKEKKPVKTYEGRILSFGFTTYVKNGLDTGNPSYAVDVMTEDGKISLYGIDLQRAITDTEIQVGDMVTLLKYPRIPAINADTNKKSSGFNPWVITKVLS